MHFYRETLTDRLKSAIFDQYLAKLLCLRNGVRLGHSYYGRLIRNLYTLYRMALFPLTLSDPELTPNHPILYIFVAFHTFVVGRDRDFKFGR